MIQTPADMASSPDPGQVFCLRLGLDHLLEVLIVT